MKAMNLLLIHLLRYTGIQNLADRYECDNGSIIIEQYFISFSSLIIYKIIIILVKSINLRQVDDDKYDVISTEMD